MGCRGVKSCGSGEGQVVSCCEHGNERFHSIKYRENL